MMNSQQELVLKKQAVGVYGWLRWLALLTAPVFLFVVFFELGSRSSFLERIWTATWPATPYFFVLLLYWMGAKHAFMKKHVQQAVVLVLLRIAAAALALNISLYPEEGLWLFVIFNSLLWYLGSLIGVRQVNAGEGYFVQEGERLGNLPVNELAEIVKNTPDAPAQVLEPAAKEIKVPEPVSEDLGMEQELKLKKVARSFYQAIRWLAIIAVPLFANLIEFLDDGGGIFIAAVLAAGPYFFVLYLFSRSEKHPFVIAHHRQALLLVALRIMTATLAGYLYSVPFFLVVNGLQWLFGPIWGMQQVDDGKGLFVKVSDQLSSEAVKTLQGRIKGTKETQIQAERAYSEAETLLQQKEPAAARAKLRQAFRFGDAQTRKLSVLHLEEMDEVEVF